MSGQTPDRGEMIVLQSFPTPRPTTNPYIVMLAEAIAATPGVSVLTWSWKTALLGRYDVVHVHWPENLTHGQNALKQWGRLTLLTLWWLRLVVQRTPVVRTVHNLHLPQGLGPWQRWILRRLEHRVRARIRLNHTTEVVPPCHTIVHGDYQRWYSPHPRAAAVPGTLAFVGLVRRYKGVEELVQAWTALPEESARERRLTITGHPSAPELCESITQACDDRVCLDFRYVDDATLVHRVTEAQCVVLPYAHMHNSGSVLAALSLGRPVLVPRCELTLALAEEVGHEWVLTFSPPLDSTDLERALERTDPVRLTSHEPDLSARGWDQTGLDHAQVYASVARHAFGGSPTRE